MHYESRSARRADGADSLKCAAAKCSRCGEVEIITGVAMVVRPGEPTPEFVCLSCQTAAAAAEQRAREAGQPT